jgi:cytochrome P450
MATNYASSEVIPSELAVELVRPAAYGTTRIIDDVHKWLRDNIPLGRAAIDGFDPFWVVTRHADITSVSQRNDVFHSGERSLMIMDKTSVAHTEEFTGTQNLVQSIATMDEPKHAKYRRLTQQWFMPRSLAERESRIRSVAKTIVEQMLATGPELDFVKVVGSQYPLRVIMEILGVPSVDQNRMLTLTHRMVGIDDVDLGREAGGQNFAERFFKVRDEFGNYFQELSKEKRAIPADDVASLIANAVIDGQAIGDREATDYYVAITTAGHDTTSSSIAGAIWGLTTNPSEFAKVQANSALIPKLIEEAIRWVTPIQSFMRCATSSHRLGDREIAPNDWLMLCYPSGNRDEEVFDEPYAFRADRSPNRHLGFGHGVHSCLGMHLARLEMRILFEELLPRIKQMALVGQPQRADGLVVGGVKSLPIRFAVQ